MLRRRRALATFAFAFALASIVACGQGDGDGDGALPSPGTEPPGAPTGAAPAESDDAGGTPGADPDASPTPPESADAGPPRLIEHVVAPKTTDPAIDQWLEDHYAYRDTRAPALGKLVLYLGGAGSVPKQTLQMPKLLASWGFHVVALRYDDEYLIVDICNADPDPDCHGKLRFEAFDGQDHSPHIDVRPPNGIENRLTKLLAWLAARFPAERWGDYLDAGAAKWSLVVAAGHSHGASEAGRIGTLRSVARVVMLSGPYDNRAGTPAAWTSGTSATPASKMFAFSHVDDPQHDQHMKDLAAMGLGAFGAPRTVEGVASPWSGSHELEATAAPAAGGNAHSTTTASASSPLRADGSYRYEGVWKYLFGD